MLHAYESIGHKFCPPDMRHLVTLAEQRKSQPSDLSWCHLPAKKKGTIKSWQTHLTHQLKSLDPPDSATKVVRPT
ncbi:hypothetical protein TNCV_476372 [Trichonephila clavipes]|nr:hypothetical protein TNCV_476372 [Trichonephila clavipes]